jgi:hypothetical protein
VKSINPLLVKAAIDLGEPVPGLREGILPGALPNIFTGLRLGAGMALILVFITEIEATKAGLGFLLWEAFQLLGRPRSSPASSPSVSWRRHDVAAPVARAPRLSLGAALSLGSTGTLAGRVCHISVTRGS